MWGSASQISIDFVTISENHFVCLAPSIVSQADQMWASCSARQRGVRPVLQIPGHLSSPVVDVAMFTEATCEILNRFSD